MCELTLPPGNLSRNFPKGSQQGPPEPNLKSYLIKGVPTISLTISVLAVESRIAYYLTNLQKKYLKKIDIGSYPFFRLGKVGVSVVLRSVDKKVIEKCKIEFLKILKINKIKIYSI